MEGNMNTVQRDPFVRRDADMRQLMLTLKELQEVVANAQMIWGTGRCMVDKKTVSDQVDLIARLLPESVKQASAIIKDEQNIRENARREANEQTAKAREDAQKAIDDAAREAQKTRDDNKKAAEDAASALYAQAQQEANALLARAQQEAQMIRSDAENAARAAVAEENVYRMAVMQANELREETEKNMAAMRQNYVGALCNMMGEVDDYLISLVSSIRAERQELINRR